MTGRILFAGIAMLALLAGLGAPAIAQDQGPEARKALMRSNGQAFGSIRAIAGGEGAVADAVALATTINENAKQMAAVFDGGMGTGQSRAKPEIWTDWDGFLQLVAALDAESAKLVAAAQSGNREALAAQFGTLGSAACGACHGTFRGPRN